MYDWGTWSTAEEEQFGLTSHELQYYSSSHFGTDKRQVSLKDVAATIPHSSANAFAGALAAADYKDFIQRLCSEVV